MRTQSRLTHILGLSIAPLLILIAPVAAGAHERQDFLLEVPRGTVTLRGGLNLASANSDIYDFTIDQLTVDRRDFYAPTFGLDVGLRLTERLDAVFGLEYSHREVESEFRDFVDQDGLPIVQQTLVTQLPLTAGLRYYFVPRGRTVGSYTWVPRKYAVYGGIGGGLMRYEFRQRGDFVDFNDFTIFRDSFRSEDWTSTLYASTGADIKLTPRIFLAIDLRYVWADSELEGDFVGFDPIDLSGLRTTTGVSFVF